MKDARCSKCRIRSQRRRSESNPLVTVTTKSFGDRAWPIVIGAVSGWHLTAGAEYTENASHENSASPPTLSRSPDKRNPLTRVFIHTGAEMKSVGILWRPQRWRKIALEGDAHGQISVSLSGSHGVQRGLCLYARHLNKTHTCAESGDVKYKQSPCLHRIHDRCAIWVTTDTRVSVQTPLLQPEKRRKAFLLCVYLVCAHREWVEIDDE